MSAMEVIVNDRTGRKARVKCNSDDTIGDLKKLIAAQIGTNADRIILKKWNILLKNQLTVYDYEISDGQSLELYYS